MALFFGAWCDGGLGRLADGAFFGAASDFLGEIAIWSGSILGVEPDYLSEIGI